MTWKRPGLSLPGWFLIVVHFPFRGGNAVEQQLESGARLRPRPLQEVAQPPRQRRAGKHRIGRAERRKQRRTGHIGVRDVMKTASSFVTELLGSVPIQSGPAS